MISCCVIITLHTFTCKGVRLEKYFGIAGVVQDVPPLDGINVTQQGIVGDLYPSFQNLWEEMMIETQNK